MRVVRSRLVPLVLLTAVAGCDDRPPPTAPPGNGPSAALAAASSAGGGAESHEGTVDRFALELGAAGALRPGVPLRITATARALLPTADAEISLAAPEIASARGSGWSPRAYRAAPTGAPVPALERSRGALARGGTRTLGATFSVGAPGYYRVVAVAAPAGAEPNVIAGRIVQNAAHRQLWLWVTEAGGRITPEFDASLFGDTLLAQPGPFRALRRDGAEAGAAPSAAPEASFSASSTDLTRPQVRYFNTDPSPNSYDPVPGAQVDIRYRYVDHSGYLRDDWTIQYTDADGRLQIDCGVLGDSYNGDVTYAVHAYTANTRVQVGAGSGVTTSYQEKLQATCSGTGYLWNPPVTTLELENRHARIFINLQETIRASDGLFQRARGWVKVLIPADGSGSRYSVTDEIIYIAEGKVWAPEGIRSQAHEYGHAFHGAGLDYRFADRLQNCPTAGHYLRGPHNLGCGYREGFAHFFAAVTRGSLAAEIESGVYYPGTVYYTSDSFAEDGSTIEGAIASFFWDATDPANESHDAVQFSVRDLGELIRTCEAYQSGWRRANAIDHLIYCMEGQVDPNVTGHPYYFATRSTDPTSQRHGSAFPAGQQSAIRTAWVHNLHRAAPSGGGAEPPPECDFGTGALQPC